MPRVAVSAEVLRWARDRSRLSSDLLAHDFPHFSDWEAGSILPTLRQLEDFARKTMIPLGYLFLPHPVEEQTPIPIFRTNEPDAFLSPSPDLRDTIDIMLRRQDWMRDFLIEEERPALKFVGSATAASEPHDVAKSIRDALGFGDSWAAGHSTWSDALRGLTRAAEQAGILVMSNGVVGNNNHRKLDPGEFRGFVLADVHAPLVFINAADFKSAQMFTFAHELAHVWLAESAAFDLKGMQPAADDIERASDRIAAEFLVPEDTLRALWPGVRGMSEPFQQLARQFKVSKIVAARRALDLGLLSRDDFFAFYDAYRNDERRQAKSSSSDGNFWNTQGVRVSRHFGEAVVLAAREGRLLYREAYRLTGLRGATFDTYADKLGLGGR